MPSGFVVQLPVTSNSLLLALLSASVGSTAGLGPALPPPPPLEEWFLLCLFALPGEVHEALLA